MDEATAEEGTRRCTARQSVEWCAGHYDDCALEADRRHESEIVEVPTVMLHRLLSLGNSLERIAEAVTVDIVAMQHDGDKDIWVSISGSAQRIELSLESMCRLHGGLGQLLDGVRKV